MYILELNWIENRLNIYNNSFDVHYGDVVNYAQYRWETHWREAHHMCVVPT